MSEGKLLEAGDRQNHPLHGRIRTLKKEAVDIALGSLFTVDIGG